MKNPFKESQREDQELEAIEPTANQPSSAALSIKEAALELGLSQIYVRHAIREGKLHTVKVPISPESKTLKHMIEVSEIERWRQATAAHSHREDGRSRFLLYATLEELEKVKQLLSETGNEAIIEKPRYSKKPVEA